MSLAVLSGDQEDRGDETGQNHQRENAPTVSLGVDVAAGFFEDNAIGRRLRNPRQRLFQGMENDAVLSVAVIIAEGFRLANKEIDALVDEEVGSWADVGFIVGPDFHALHLNARSRAGNPPDSLHELGSFGFVRSSRGDQSSEAFFCELELLVHFRARQVVGSACAVDPALQPDALDLERIANRL